MKINIALTININSSSSPDKREGNDDLAQNFFRILPIKLTFHLRIRWLASYFAVQRRPERKLERYICKVYEFFNLCSGQLWLYQTNENNDDQHFSNNFLIQFVYQERLLKVFDKSSFICCFFNLYKCHIDVSSVYYVYFYWC